MDNRVTLSVIKADIGGFVGHCGLHPEVMKAAKAIIAQKGEGLLLDYYLTSVGDDLNLILTHRLGIDSVPVHQLAWEAFQTGAAVAHDLKLYGAGQDLLADAFSGNVRGLGPGVAELELTERQSEPVIIFMADKTEPGAWNFPLYKIFADPFNTAGLVIDPKLHRGFRFEVHDLVTRRKILFSAPEELYDLLVCIGAPGRFCIKSIYSKETGDIAAASTTQKLNLLAGRYVGKDDPVCIVRCQSGFPAVGEALEPFAFPHLVAGWMRGSHHGPLLPVAQSQATPTRFDGPPRVIALGFQLCHGRLIGPQDFFADPAFDGARRQANEIADYLRRLGPFEPHRLPLDAMEYTTMPEVMRRLQERFTAIEE